MFFKSINVQNGCSNCSVVVRRYVHISASLLRREKSSGSPHSGQKVNIATIVQLECVIPDPRLIMRRNVLLEDMENTGVEECI